MAGIEWSKQVTLDGLNDSNWTVMYETKRSKIWMILRLKSRPSKSKRSFMKVNSPLRLHETVRPKSSEWMAGKVNDLGIKPRLPLIERSLDLQLNRQKDQNWPVFSVRQFYIFLRRTTPL